MTEWNRRSVLTTGAAFAASGMFASAGAGKSTSNGNRPVLEEPAGWPSFRGNAGNTGSLPLDGDFDEPDTVAWEYDEQPQSASPISPESIAVVDGSVYLITEGSEVHALADDDGTLEWAVGLDGASGSPAVADDTVYVGGDQLTALDASTGAVLWTFEAPVPSPTVAYDTVYVVSDGTLSALEADTGDVRWERNTVEVGTDDAETDPQEYTISGYPIAAAAGYVYAITEETDESEDPQNAIAAFDPLSGETHWTGGADSANTFGGPLVADEREVSARNGLGYAPGPVLDPETGDKLGFGYEFSMGGSVRSEDVLVTKGDFHKFSVTSREGDEISWSRTGRTYQSYRPIRVVGESVIYFTGNDVEYEDENALIGRDIRTGDEKWRIPIDHWGGAITNDTIYVVRDEKLVALRSGSGDDKGGTVDRPADTRVTADQTGPSGVRIAVDEDLAGLELTISEQTSGVDTAEIADAVGNPLATRDVSGLGPGDTFQIEHDLRAGEEYIVLASADDAYDRGAYNEEPTWPYDGGEFQVVEGIWARDRSSTANFYAYTTLTALLDGDGGGDDPGDGDGTVDRPADTRVTPDTTTPSGVRIETQDALSGLELTISENTTGADTAEIANSLGETLAAKDISGLGPGDTFQIEHDLRADEEYIVLIDADDAYDRGAYNEEPAWPYDGGSFQVLEGIWARDRSSTANFYAYTTLTALPGDDDDGGNGGDGTVDRPADTRLTPDTTTPSGVRIETQEALSGLELTISENTTGADTAEIADGLGNTLVTKDISGLGPDDTFQIEHDLAAGEEYIVLIGADGSYDRGAYNDDPAWPYDGGSFQVVEGIWGRDNSSTANFYAYTTLTALQ